RHQGMRDGMDGEGDAVLHADFAHELRDVSFNGALFDAEGGADLFVGAAGNQHLQNFLFAVGKGNPAGGEDAPRGCAYAFDESREHAARSPHRTLIYDAKSLDKLGRRRSLVHVAFGAGRDGFEDTFIVHTGAGYDDAQVGPDGFHAGHDVVQVLATAIAQQDQIDGLQLAQLGQRGGDQLQIWFGIKEGPESHKPQRIALHYGDTYQRLSGDGSFHQGFPVRIASC